jgi:CelD/BcsL family acetyltransferase involved in cellulose biosynthesis
VITESTDARITGLRSRPLPRTYDLVELPESTAANWDALIAPYPARTLFHTRAWLDYLSASRGIRLRFWEIREGAESVGHLCGGLLQKGPFRILGSPLRGWGTNSMGPVSRSPLDQRAFLSALDTLARRESLSIVELESPGLSDDTLQEFGYQAVAQPTYLVELTPGDPNRMWDRLERKSCRYEIARAKRLGVRVEPADDDAFVDEFYDQFVEVLARKKLYPPYSRETARLLFRHLRGRDLLFAFRVRGPNGASLATGLFPHDDRAVYFWGGASRISSWEYSPNDLLQWTLMETAAARGLRVYDMCGFGRFKRKFGGTLVSPRRWHKCYSLAARWSRAAYELYFKNRVRARGWLSFAARRSQAQPAADRRPR